MNFHIYSDYEITVKNKYCYINEDGDHVKETKNFTRTIDGGKLAEFIAEQLKDREFSSVITINNSIIISTFNPMNGTGADISIIIKEKEQKQ